MIFVWVVFSFWNPISLFSKSNHFQKNSSLDIILKQVYQLAVDDYNDNAYDGKYLNFNNLVQELRVRFYAYNGITNKMLEQLKGKELNPKIRDEINSKTSYSSLYETDVKYIVKGNNNFESGVPESFNVLVKEILKKLV